MYIIALHGKTRWRRIDVAEMYDVSWQYNIEALVLCISRLARPITKFIPMGKDLTRHKGLGWGSGLLISTQQRL